MTRKEILKILETAKDKNGDIPMRLVRQAFEKLPEPCDDTISRQAAIDAVERNSCNTQRAIDAVNALPSAQRWIPTSKKLPDELAEVNVTWENTEPEPYYDFIKGHYFTGTAVYFRGRWYWYSAVCVDYLREYGFSPNDEMDDAIKVIAWMPLPEPWRGEQDEHND